MLYCLAFLRPGRARDHLQSIRAKPFPLERVAAFKCAQSGPSPIPIRKGSANFIVNVDLDIGGESGIGNPLGL